MISYSQWSTASGGINTEVAVDPGGVLTLSAGVTVPDWFKCDLQEFVEAALFAANGVLYENHPVQKWIDAINLPADGAISTNVSSSEGTPASTLTLTCANSGELTVTSDQGMTLKGDLKLFLIPILRTGQLALRNVGAAVGTSWGSLYNTLRFDSGFFEL